MQTVFNSSSDRHQHIDCRRFTDRIWSQRPTLVDPGGFCTCDKGQSTLLAMGQLNVVLTAPLPSASDAFNDYLEKSVYLARHLDVTLQSWTESFSACCKASRSLAKQGELQNAFESVHRLLLRVKAFPLRWKADPIKMEILPDRILLIARQDRKWITIEGTYGED
jgi:hypothetical protein